MRNFFLLFMLLLFESGNLFSQGLNNLPILDYSNKIADSIKQEVQCHDSIYIIAKEYYDHTHDYEFIVYNKKSAFHNQLYRRFSNRSYDTIFFNKMYKDQIDTISFIPVTVPKKYITKWVPVYKYCGDFFVYNDCEFQVIYELTDSTFITYFMDDSTHPKVLRSVEKGKDLLKLVTANKSIIRFELIDPKTQLYKICFTSGKWCGYFTPLNSIFNFYIIEHHCHDESSNMVNFDKVEFTPEI